MRKAQLLTGVAFLAGTVTVGTVANTYETQTVGRTNDEDN